MRVSIIVLLVVSCRFSTALGIYNREDITLRSDIRRNDPEFFYRIDDWLRHVRDRIYGRIFGTTTEPPVPVEIFDLDKFEIEQRFKDHKGFSLDLSNLSFDPNRDWGFHVGHWYFIRKADSSENRLYGKDSGNVDIQSWSNSGTNVQNTVKTDGGFGLDGENDLKTTEPSSITPTTEVPTTHAVMQSMTQSGTQSMTETTTQIDSLEGFTTEKKEWIGDIETNNDVIHNGSVEVLMG